MRTGSNTLEGDPRRSARRCSKKVALNRDAEGSDGSKTDEDNEDDPKKQVDKMGEQLSEIQAAVSKFDDELKTSWDHRAEKLGKQYCKILPLPSEMSILKDSIRGHPFGCVAGDETGFVVMHYDVKQRGEPITNPNIRVCPFQEKQYSRKIGALLEARATDGEPAKLNSCEVALISDGGKGGNVKSRVSP